MALDKPKRVNKDDKFYLPEECDLQKVTVKDLEIVSLAKRIDRDLAHGHTVQLGFPLYFLWNC